MAIDLYSDTTGGTTSSPRISFSYDLTQSDTVPVEQLLRSFSSSSVDFNFIINNHSDHHHADELFYEGKLVPTEIKLKLETSKCAILSPTPPRPETVNSRLVAEVVEPQENTNKSSFWGFKRSSSCGSGYGRSLCPITLLSRSHSTGSSTSSKRSSSSKEGCTSKQNKSFQKKPLVSQKPPLRKSGYEAYGNNSTSNGIKVNPVLNLRFGSFFSSNNKNKSKK